MKILGIGGSLRPQSNASKAIKEALKKCEELGCMAELLSLKELNLPFCNGSENYPDFPDVALFRSKVSKADGIILASPEYHGSISGVLKNALDLLDFEHVEGKVFGLISVLGGDYSTNAVNTIRTICRHLHAWVVPEQVVIPHADEAFDTEGNLVDIKLQQRMDAMIIHFVKYTRKLSSEV